MSLMSEVDYTLYLVTDSTMLPESKTFLQQVEAAIVNGATLIQIREKDLSTREFIKRAEEVHEITKRYGIPLIINDRLDVALAIDAEGLHIGQDDMDCMRARKLLGSDKIIGVTCSSVEEVREACKENLADYLGLGTVFKTATKKDVTDPNGVGPIGIKKMLHVLKEHNSKSKKRLKCVAIGGINHSNVSNILYQTSIAGQSLDGVAVVSCIMANPNAAAATASLLDKIKYPDPWFVESAQGSSSVCAATTALGLKKHKPLVHHITNNVVKNFSANVTLAVGASPIMSELSTEYEEFVENISTLSLVLNLGTPTPQLMETFETAIKAYNSKGKPIVFDPVAVGASEARKKCVKSLLNIGYFSVIKGNLAEILALNALPGLGDAGKFDVQKGVDSDVELDENSIINLGSELASTFRCIIVITGKTNYIIDGAFNSVDSYEVHEQEKYKVAIVPGGHELMGNITGTGCSLGSVIASFLAIEYDKPNATRLSIFESVTNAVKLYNASGKKAAESCKSPGSFQYKFLDSLFEHTN